MHDAAEDVWSFIIHILAYQPTAINAIRLLLSTNLLRGEPVWETFMRPPEMRELAITKCLRPLQSQHNAFWPSLTKTLSPIVALQPGCCQPVLRRSSCQLNIFGTLLVTVQPWFWFCCFHAVTCRKLPQVIPRTAGVSVPAAHLSCCHSLRELQGQLPAKYSRSASWAPVLCCRCLYRLCPTGWVCCRYLGPR